VIGAEGFAPWGREGGEGTVVETVGTPPGEAIEGIRGGGGGGCGGIWAGASEVADEEDFEEPCE